MVSSFYLVFFHEIVFSLKITNMVRKYGTCESISTEALVTKETVVTVTVVLTRSLVHAFISLCEIQLSIIELNG